MRWRAAHVPLAAVTAATLLFTSAAWAQSPEDEPTPAATEVESPTPTPSAEPSAEQTTEPTEPTETERARAQAKQPSSKDDPDTSRDTDRPDGSPETQADPQRLTLYATPKVVTVGQSVRIWGKASPDGGGRWIQIVNPATGYKLRSVKTAPDGTFDGRLRVRKNVPIQARYGGVRSDWRHLGAVPKLKVGLGDTKLFGKTKVSGRTSRAVAGGWVKLKLRNLTTGKVVKSSGTRIGKLGNFKKRFRITKPGTYRAKAIIDNHKWRTARAKSGRSRTPLPSLSRGSHSVYVKLLEKRLVQLGHHLRGRNRSFGQDTADAVMAFNKVNRRARVSYVTAATWSALAYAKRPKARFDSPGFHIEVNQSKQVLYVVRGGKVRGILHVSTGAASTPTYNGTYQFWGKIAGYSPKRLYYPSYFHGARGIHGWPSVPPYNASHGCVRVPMWAAKWIYAKIEIGDTIRIYR